MKDEQWNRGGNGRQTSAQISDGPWNYLYSKQDNYYRGIRFGFITCVTRGDTFV